MNYKDLSRKLWKFNCVFDRQAKGSHEIWRSSIHGAKTTIPNWGSKDLKVGTVRRIVRELRIDKDDFNRA